MRTLSRIVLMCVLLSLPAGQAMAATNLENAYIVLSEVPVSAEFETIFRSAARTTKPVVALATEVDHDVVSELVERLDGIVQIAALQASEEQLRKIAGLTGGKILSDLGNVTLKDLGRASRVQIGDDGSTTFFGNQAAAAVSSASASTGGNVVTTSPPDPTFALQLVLHTGTTREMAAQKMTAGGMLSRLTAMAGQQPKKKKTESAGSDEKGNWFCTEQEQVCVQYVNVPRSNLDAGQCHVGWQKGECPRDETFLGTCRMKLPGAPSYFAYRRGGQTLDQAMKACARQVMSEWETAN